MPDLLIELFSEEIPARMQARAADDLKRLVTDALVERGLTYEGAKAFATPRRLALVVGGLPARQPDRSEERKGPRVGAPDKAIEGFLKASGLGSIEEAVVQPDPKGDFYLARIAQPGRAATEVVAEIMPEIVRGFPWPKSMRWGSGKLRWVRPLHAIVATFGSPQEDPEVVRFEVDGIVSGDMTRGHRVLAPEPFRVRRFEDYVEGLEKARVMLDPERRRDVIRADARTLAEAQNLEVVEDEALVEEVAGLVEWPVVLMGAFDEEFLEVPDEVIRATIRANQKCFVLRRPVDGPRGSGRVGVGFGSLTKRRDESPAAFAGAVASNAVRLSNRFVLVANLEAADGGAAIVHGNERVVRARLADARFFWETDRKTTLGDRLDKLKAITFHEKLGTQFERVERITRLARELALALWNDEALAAKAEQAARLSKADLVTEMVGEFPELQGVMGRYYALEEKLDPKIAAALEEHYRPQGPSDRVPTAPVSVAVALADKIDTLVGFWAIDEKPTGSKDPYALRRAALGVVRIVLDNGLRLRLSRTIAFPLAKQIVEHNRRVLRQKIETAQKLADLGVDDETLETLNAEIENDISDDRMQRLADGTRLAAMDVADNLLAFLADRLKVQLREQGARHDLLDAVFAAGFSPPPLRGMVGEGGGAEKGAKRGAGVAASSSTPTPDPSPQGGGGKTDDLVLIVRRVEALAKLLETENGRNLLAGYRRAANILKAEEKKDGAGAFEGAPDEKLLTEKAEIDLAAALDAAEPRASGAIAAEDFAAATGALAKLRPEVDAFFETVTVNAPDPALRANRLKLLARLRRATRAVADFDRISGG